MKRCGLILLLLVVSLWGMAQTRTISGSLFDAELKKVFPLLPCNSLDRIAVMLRVQRQILVFSHKRKSPYAGIGFIRRFLCLIEVETYSASSSFRSSMFSPSVGFKSSSKLVMPALIRMSYHCNSFLMSLLWTRSRSNSGSTSAKKSCSCLPDALRQLNEMTFPPSLSRTFASTSPVECLLFR